MTSTSTDRRFGVNVGAAVKVPCRLATTANINLSTNGLAAIDGVVPAASDRILVKNQTTDSQNGIYLADSGTWTRDADFDGKYDIKKGTLVKVNEGNTNQGFWYVSSSDWPTVDTSSITFAQASSVLAVVTAFAQTILAAASASAARTVLGVPSTSEAILQTIGTTKGDIITFTAASTSTRKAVGATDGYCLSANSGDTDGLRYLPPGMGFNLINGYLSWTVAGNALTCAIKGYDGNDPSATNPVYAWIRSATAATGSPTLAKITAASSASLSSGSTGGTRNAVACNIWAVLFDDAGTYRLGLINCLTTVAGAGAGSDVPAIYPLGQFPIASSTAEGGAGAADSSQTFYTGTAVSSKPYAVLGYAYFAAGQAAAGTWATAPTRQHLYMAGGPLPGQTIQVQRTDSGAVATGATVIPDDDTIPQITEGDQYMTQVITPSSAANVIRWSALAVFANSGAGDIAMALYQDAVANALKATIINAGATGLLMDQKIDHFMLAATTSAITGRIRIGGGGAGTTTFNGLAAGRKFGGVMNSYLEAAEVMA